RIELQPCEHLPAVARARAGAHLVALENDDRRAAARERQRGSQAGVPAAHDSHVRARRQRFAGLRGVRGRPLASVRLSFAFGFGPFEGKARRIPPVRVFVQRGRLGTVVWLVTGTDGRSIDGSYLSQHASARAGAWPDPDLSSLRNLRI